MLHLHLLFIGKTRFPELDGAIKRYLDRLAHYATVEVNVIKAEKVAPKIRDEDVRSREAGRVLKIVDRGAFLLVWDEKGRQLDSMQLSEFVNGLQRDGHSHVWMVLGGPLGVSSRLLAEADSVLSLSRMTFPHDLARLLVVEQLYRAFTILKGEPYHK